MAYLKRVLPEGQQRIGDRSHRPKLAEVLPVLYVRNSPAVDPLR